MHYYLFSTHDRGSFEVCVEENRLWGRNYNKHAFKNLDINKGDKVIFYCSEEKQFIAECEILELPKPIEEHEDIDQNEWKEVPVAVRLEKIRDLNMPLDDDNWRYLNTFKDLKDRKSVSASLESKSRREIDILDYNFITNKE